MSQSNVGDFLVVEDLHTHFQETRSFFSREEPVVVKAVDGISLTVRKGEILGLVGESGCGKSTLGRTIMQLVRPTKGRVLFEGEELTALSQKELRAKRINFQMIFQDPYASLNPRLTIYDMLAEAISTRFPNLSGDPLYEKVAQLMNRVGMNPAMMKRYPHEFSGGQRQRVAIARALATEPKLIVADEPVSALDVSIQSQILNLLKKLCAEMGLTMVFVSHDLSVVRYISDRIAVMYMGRILELGSAEAIVDNPQHIYTRALMSAIPLPDPKTERHRERIVLTADASSSADQSEASRGSGGDEEKANEIAPGLTEVSPGHFVDQSPFHLKPI